jgi:hypothetical protein
MGGSNQPPNRVEMQATDLLTELKEAKDNDKHVYILRDADIVGGLDLSNRTVEIALDMQGCHFFGRVDLRYCESKQTVDFSHCTFHEEFLAGDENGSHTTFRKDLICNGAVFCEAARFRGVRCEGKALFREACFHSPGDDADFGGASFEQALDYDNAQFCGGAKFNLVRCGVASFQNAEFKSEEKLVDFATASFKYLDCWKAIFKGPVSFYGSRFADGASFGRAQFMREFIRENICLWPRSADLNSNSIDLRFAYFGSNLDFTSGYFQRALGLAEAKISSNLDLTAAEFKDSLSLYGTTIGRLVLKNTSFKERSLDLRECTFEWFTGTDENARALVRNQDPIKLSTDPYLQLEKYYNRIGDEAKARVIYREGRHRVRKNARTVYRKPLAGGENIEPENIHAQWPWQRHLSDWILEHLTGYGVQTWRLFLGALFFIVIGTAVFAAWSDNALVEVEASASSTSSGATLVASTASFGEQSTYDWRQAKHWVHRFAYSLDLFLPVVKLGLDEQWVPNGTVPKAYAYVHVFLGWLLVPLLLASLAGIIKRQS